MTACLVDAEIDHPPYDIVDMWKSRCEGLARISEATAWSVDAATVYQNMVDAVMDVLNCDEAHMHLLDESASRFVKCAYSSDSVYDYSSTEFDASLGRTQWMISNHSPIVMDYLHPHKDDRIPQESLEEGFKSAVSIPLIAGEDVLGMCSIVYKRPMEWSEDTLDFLVSIGRVLGVAVQRINTTKKALELQVLDERKQLSQEIHDNLAQVVVSLSLSADMALMSYEDGDDEAVREDLEHLEKASKQTTQMLRDEMLSLRIPLEQTEGLIDGMRQCLDDFENHWHIETSFDVRTEEEPLIVPLRMALPMTRILNESLQNVLHHAEATHVWVTLSEDVDRIALAVRDNGHGFDIDKVPPERLGIRIMKERATAAGGSLNISSDAEGTTVDLQILRASWK